MARESIFAILQFTLIVALLVTALAWFVAYDTPRPPSVWILVAPPLVAVCAVAGLFWWPRGRDLAPDYLSEISPDYFEQNGFCFTILPADDNGLMRLCVYYQNRYDHPAHANIQLHPAQQFMMNRRRLDPVRLTVECKPGEFGKLGVPWPVPEKYQGLKQQLDLSARVTYPQGRGRALRAHEGLRVGRHQAESPWLQAVVVVVTLGMMRATRPARVVLELPIGVATELPEGAEITRETIWVLGDEKSS